MTPRKPLHLAFLLLAAAFVVMASWWVYSRYFSERANPLKELYPVRGIDISAHNGLVDFDRLAQEPIQFAYIKATEGTDFQDRNFVRNACELKRIGLPTGAYHFFRFDTNGEMQALNFLHAIKGRNFELPPAIDLEEWTNPDDLTTYEILTELRLLLATLRREGIIPIIYTNKDGYNRFVKQHLANYQLWICSFTDPPLQTDTKWDIWQYSHRSHANGIDGFVDYNTLHPSSKINFLLDSIKFVRQNSMKLQ